MHPLLHDFSDLGEGIAPYFFYSSIIFIILFSIMQGLTTTQLLYYSRTRCTGLAEDMRNLLFLSLS